MAVVAVWLAPERHEATSVLVVEDPGASQIFESTGSQAPDRYVQDQVAILQSTAVAQTATEIAGALDPDASIEIEELIDHAEIGSTRSSNVIEVVYMDSEPARAISLANSIAEAYQEVRRTEALASFVRAIDELDESIASLDTEVATLQMEVEDLRYGDPARAELFNQYELSLQKLGELQGALSDSTPEQDVDSLRAELDDVSQQLQTLQLVLNLDVLRPELVALLNRQEEASSRRSELAARRAQLEVDAELASGVALYFPATATEPGGLSLALAVVGGGVAGFFIGLAFAYLLFGRRHTIDSRLAPQQILSAPLLAEIPDFDDERLDTFIPVYAAAKSVAAESFRFAAAALELQGRADKPPSLAEGGLIGETAARRNLVVVVSAEEDDGKSVVTANTALASCWTGNRVLVIDADFGSQTQARLLMQSEMPHHGLADVIAGEVTLQAAVRTVQLNPELRLDLLTRGQVPVSATDLLRSHEADEFFASVAENYDLVLIDTPPLLRVAYSSVLCRHANRAMVVVLHGSDESTLENLSDRLRLIGTPITGYVYNRAPLESHRGGYGGSLQDVLGATVQNSSEPPQAKHRR